MHEIACRRFSIALCCLLSACGQNPPPRSQPNELLGDVMPSFESKSLNGNPVFSGAFEGRRLVVSFVASGCEPCETTLAAAQGMYADSSDVVVVGVFGPDDADDANVVVRRHAIRFPVVVDRDGAIARRFHVGERPTTFVADGYGRVKWVAGPDMTQADLTSAVQSLN
jgi:peroxiredoxin